MTDDWQTPFRSLAGVTIESEGTIWPILVRGSVDGVPFSFSYRYGERYGEWRVEIGEHQPWSNTGGDLPSPEKVASMLAKAFELWRADSESMSDATKARRRFDAHLDEQRERLRQVDDATLAELITHLRLIESDPHFDPIEFLCGWLLARMPPLGGLTPAEVLSQPGGLERVKDLLGRWVYGTSA